MGMAVQNLKVLKNKLVKTQGKIPVPQEGKKKKLFKTQNPSPFQCPILYE